MARVPVVEGNSVRTEALPSAQINTAAPAEAFGMGQARQLQQLGQGASDLGVGLFRAQQEANQSRVDDALNQLRETELDLAYNPEQGYTNLKGVQALQRPDNKPLSDDYFDKRRTQTDQIESGLSNDMQKQAFRQRATDRLTQFRGNLMNYEGQENRNYELSVASGTISTASREIAAFYNDPERIAGAVGSIQAAAVKDGRLRGLSAEQIENNSRKLVSGAHLGASCRCHQLQHLQNRSELRGATADWQPIRIRGDGLWRTIHRQQYCSRFSAGAPIAQESICSRTNN